METGATSGIFTWAEFYNKLGYAFYAILASQGSVSGDQMEFLRKHVQRKWGDPQKPPIGFEGYMMAKVDSVFDWLHLNDADWNYCIQEFGFFLSRNQNDITPEMKLLMRHQVDEVARLMATDRNEALKEIHKLLD